MLGAITSGAEEVPFSDRPRFTRHMDEHGKFQNEELHQCDTCQGMFLKQSYFSHVEFCKQSVLDIDDQNFLCKLCDFRGVDYNRHSEEHITGKPYKCSECSLSSNSRKSLQNHCFRSKCGAQRPHVIASNHIECGNCREVFQGRKSFLKHYIEAHVIVLKQFDWCNDCKLWIKIIEARYHRQKAHSSTFVCDVCGKAFKTQQSVNHHKLSHTEATMPCEYCAKKFKRNDQLRRHVLNVHETVGKTLVCTFCGQCYKTATTLQAHIKAYHGPTVEHTCEICGKCFKTASTRNNHMLTHSEERPFKCSKCPKSFKSSAVLSTHMVSHSDVRKFKCDICGDAFKQPTHLKYHMLKHTGVRAFPCHFCGKSFQRKQILETHILSHTGERPFSCAVCEKGFLKKTDLNKHICEAHGVIHMKST